MVRPAVTWLDRPDMLYGTELSALPLQNVTDLWFLGFCSRHISSTTHSFEAFMGLICFTFSRRMSLIQVQRSGVLLWCRTECHNIAKFDFFEKS